MRIHATPQHLDRSCLRYREQGKRLKTRIGCENLLRTCDQKRRVIGDLHTVPDHAPFEAGSAPKLLIISTYISVGGLLKQRQQLQLRNTSICSVRIKFVWQCLLANTHHVLKSGSSRSTLQWLGLLIQQSELGLLRKGSKETGSRSMHPHSKCLIATEALL